MFSRFWTKRVHRSRTRQLHRFRPRFEALEARLALAAINVTTTADVVDPNDGVVSLREAINQANTNGQNDTIILTAGTYELQIPGAGEDGNATGDLDINALDGTLEIGGPPGTNTAIIDANSLDRAFHVHGTAVDNRVTIRDLVVRGGQANGGGGIRSDGPDVKLTNVEVQSNTALTDSSGGGIRGFVVDLFNSRVHDNISGGNGGGIFGSIVTLDGLSMVNGNSALLGNGGGISAASVSLSDESEVNENRALSGRGGGIIAFMNVTIDASQVNRNTSGSDGGGISTIANPFGGESNVFVTNNSKLIGNSTFGGRGGAIATEEGDVTVIGSTVNSNRAPGNGGAIHSDTGKVSTDGSIIGFNSSGASGGALSGLTLTISNTVCTGNAAAENGGCGAGETISVTGGSITSNTAGGDGGGLWATSDLFATDCLFQNNNASNGGAITLPSTATALSLNATVFAGNTTFPGSGGAVYSSSSIVTITNSKFTNNSSGNHGGAITLPSSATALTMTVVDFVGNGTFPGDGGAIHSLGSFNSVASGRFITNSAGGKGGAVYHSGIWAAVDSTFDGNSAVDGGAAYVDSSGVFQAIGTTISRNLASRNGGGIYNEGGGVELANTTVSTNTAGEVGGGLKNDRGSYRLTNATVFGNFAPFGGGGVFNFQGSVESLNAVIAKNASNFASSGPDFNGVVSSQGNNLVGVTNGSSGWIGSDLTGAASSPLDPKLGPLANNGGLTETHALLDGSPAIDAGDSPVTSFLDTDQRGAGFPRQHGPAVDIGAIEKQPQPGKLVFSASSYTVDESSGMVTITLVRTNGSESTVTVQYATSDGTATAGTDYDPVSGALTFGDGQTDATITVPINNDSLDENEETIILSLSDPTDGATLGTPNQATVSIVDNDPLPVLSINHVVEGAEGNAGTTDFTFTVTLLGDTSRPVTVQYATANATADAGSDYVASSGTLAFAPGESTKTITVAVLGDRDFELDESFAVRLSNPDNARIALETGVGTILNDDDAAAPVITNQGQPVSTVFPYIPTGRAARQIANQQQRIERLDLLATRFSANNQPVLALRFANLRDAASDRLAALVPLDVQYLLRLADQTTAAMATLTSFAPAGNPIVTFSLSRNPLSRDFPEFVPIPLGSRIRPGLYGNNVFVPVMVGGSLFFDLPGTSGALADVVSPADNRPFVLVSDVTKTEGAGGQPTRFLFTVTLSAPSERLVKLSYTTVNGTAQAGDGDFRARSGMLTFRPGQTTKTISFDVIGDGKKEANETFYLDLFGLSSNALFTKNRGFGTILNDD